jgi:hypothetical protein
MSRPEGPTAVSVTMFTYNQESHEGQAIRSVLPQRRGHAIHALRLFPPDGRFSPAGIVFMLRTPFTAQIRRPLSRTSAVAGPEAGNQREREGVSDSGPQRSAKR